MQMPAFVSVTFIDPWGIVPPGTQNTGVLCTVGNGSSAPDGYVLIAQLLQGAAPIAYGLGGSPSFVFVTPPGPLSAALPYRVEVQWAPPGTDPANADWTLPGIVGAPVITAGLQLVDGTVSAGNVALAWAPVSAPAPSTGIVQLLNVNAGQMKVLSAAGGSGSWPWTPAPGASYAAYVQGAALISPAVPGVYTSGPLSPPVALPVAAPTLSSVAYDGARLSVAWTSPPLPPAPAPPVADAAYALVLYSGTAPVGTFPADAGGGTAVADLGQVGGTISVAGAVSYGPLAGPPGPPQPIISHRPAVLSVAMAAGAPPGTTTVTASLRVPAGPSGTVATVSLHENGVAVASADAAGTPPQATLSYAFVPGRSYTLSACERLAGPPAVRGPATAQVPVVAGPVQGVTAAYDGARLNLAWGALPDPALTGYLVSVTGLPQTTYVTGPEPLLSIPAILSVGAAATVTVTPLCGIASGVPAAPLAFAVPAPAAPAITDAAVDGDVLSLAWSPSAGPWLDGYRVTATATPVDGGSPLQTVTFDTGPETSASLPLPAQARAAQWSVTVAAMARGTAGPGAGAVTLFPAVPVITGVTGSAASAAVAWSLAPATDAVLALLAGMDASVQVVVRDGENVVASARGAVTASAGSGTTSVALPAPRTARLTATARLVAAAQAGSPSGAVAVLTAAPAVAFGALDAGALRLDWSASGDEGVTGYTLTCAGVSATTQGTSAVLSLPVGGAPAGGTVTLAPVGADTAGPAATLPIVTAPSVASGTYDGSTLTVTLGAAGTPTPAQLRVDVEVEGTLAARAVTPGAPGGAVAIPVALPPGAAATVRATGVGSGALTPPGEAVAIPTSVPAGARAVYDGATLHVAWTPSRDAGVTGYLVTVAGATPAVPPTYVAGSATASAALPAVFPGTFPGGAAVTVAASTLVTAGHRLDGPAGAAVVPVLSGSVRGVAAAASAQPPYVYRIGAYASLDAARGADAVAYLANVFLSGTPTARDATDSPTFTLAPLSSPVTGEAAYTLTIDRSVWTSFDGSAARAPLRAAYIAFLRAVEALGVRPGGIALVRQAVAAALPQTFAETLYYRYGVWQQTSLRVVDLEPGVRLRVSGAAYQSPVGSSDARNGYVVVGTETFDLAEVFPAGSAQSGLAPALTVDAFLSQLFPGAGGQGTAVAAGPLDFLGVGARQAYFRLFYPASFLGSGATGSSSLTANVAILGAPSWTALEAATDTYAATGSFPTGGALFTAYFRGRAALTPLLAATVNGQTAWLPVGSTARQALATLGAGPGIGAGEAGAAALTRVVSDVFDHPQGGAPVRAEAVSLSRAAIGDLLPQLWPLDVPLLGGDALTVVPAVPPGA